MQRYSATNFTTAVNNAQISSSSARDTVRADTPLLTTNFAVNSRRQFQVTPYKIKCDKEPLNSRLGPPDFHPLSSNCPEETLTKEYVQFGYRETVDGIEESRDTSLSQVQSFTKPILVKCKETIRKHFRAINESRSQKRKAGQVYGVPFSGSLLYKPGVYPEQRPSGEDFRRKWIEGLSQPNKRLRSLTDHVPHGYRKKSLFEVLIRNNVPLLRATWFIKVTYLNQIRPGPPNTNISPGVSEKVHFSRTELWTKDVIDYMQSLVDEFFSRNSFRCNSNVTDLSSHVFSPGTFHSKNSSSTSSDGGELSLHLRWWYMVRMIQWHHAEGLILPSYVIDWIFHQLEDKMLIEIMLLLLPLVYGFVEHIILSHTYVRTLAGVAIRFIQEPSQGDHDLVNNSRRAYTISALVELLQYLLVAVPDTFVGFPCFPMPPRAESSFSIRMGFLSKAPEDVKITKNGSLGPSLVLKDNVFDAQHQCYNNIVTSIQKLSYNLQKSACHGYPRPNVAKVMNALNLALQVGDVREPCQILFEDLFEGSVLGNCLTDVSPCLKSSLKWTDFITFPFVSSIFLICDWATSYFRNLRTILPPGLKFTGRADFSEIYIAVRLLKSCMKDLKGLRNDLHIGNVIAGHSIGVIPELGSISNARSSRPICFSNVFQSPGPLHDIIVCWIDQHDARKEDSKRLQLLIIELVRSGIFYPQAYVRQLMVSSMVNGSCPQVDVGRWRRHYQVLKMLPQSIVDCCLREAQIAEQQLLQEIMHVYINERRFVLRNLIGQHNKNALMNASVCNKHCSGPSSTIYRKQFHCPLSSKSSTDLEVVKSAIAAYLQFPKLGGLFGNKNESEEGILSCEYCKRGKRQKVNDERTPCNQSRSPNLSDDEDVWWARKVQPKSFDCFKSDPFLKTNKPAPKGRQKTMRKTQSLAQLATARTESNQGACTSHVCDSRICCPHQKVAREEDDHSFCGVRNSFEDIGSIGRVVKQMNFVKKRKISEWLIFIVKNLLEETEKARSIPCPSTKSFSLIDEKTPAWWRIGENELLAILLLVDLCDDIISASKFLLWLWPKVHINPSSLVHTGRNVPLPKAVEGCCDVGDAFLISSIRRYENVLAAADLVPDILSAAVKRITAVMNSNGRATGSSVVVYVKYLLKKYSTIPSVTEWEKKFKDASDKRILSELEYVRSIDVDTGFPFGIPSGIEDADDFLRQKINAGRLSRVGLSMRDLVQRHVEEALHYFTIKERKQFATGGPKCVDMEKGEEGYQVSKQIIVGLIECIRQTGGAAQEGDPSLVCSAVSAIVGNVGPALVKVLDSGLAQSNSLGSMSIARCILHIHITCLCLLKEVLGERHGRAFEIAVATEATSAVVGAFVPSNEAASNPGKLVSRMGKITGAVSSLVVGIIVHGVLTLERVITVLRLKEGLDLIHFVRNVRCSSNSNGRSFRADTLVEVCLHWFRLLVGNCRSICDGLIVELLGEQYIVSLSRLQRTLSLNLILPPAYSIFAFALWRSFLDTSISTTASDDLPHLFQSLLLAICDTIKHRPFRDACMRNMHAFYDIVVSDTTDTAFASILERSNIDPRVKETTFIPLRARMFLDSIIDCKISIHIGEFKLRNAETEKKLMDKIVQSLDLLEPAKFHWQWVELRLLLNEQALTEKLKNPEVSLVDAMGSVSPGFDKTRVLENENNFIEIILTRLLVQPDASLLFSELLHLFGRSFEDSMLLQVKWFLGGPDVLYGRKSVRQRLMKIAEKKGLTKDIRSSDKMENKKTESVEEGEVVEETTDCRKQVTGTLDIDDATERALVELLLPTIDRSSEDSRCTFANELVKQVSSIEQYISSVNRSLSKLSGKGGYRKLARHPITSADSIPPSPDALRASIFLRLQLLLRLFPTICGCGDPSMQSMRHMLASVILRLLAARVVQETWSVVGSGGSLFDCLLFFLHDLLSHSPPSWMMFRPDDSVKHFSRFGREAAENLQNELDHMQLPDIIRWRIQCAMSIPPPLGRQTVSCSPPSISTAGVNAFQNSISLAGSGSATPLHRNLFHSLRTSSDLLQKMSQRSDPDTDLDIDPWLLLEDGAGSASSSSSALCSIDNASVKASCWLKGAIRVRRTDLTYVGALDDDS